MDFTIGQNLKKLKLIFWAKKSMNIILEYTKRCKIAIFGGINTAFAMLFFPPTNNLGVLVQPSEQ